MTTNHLQKFLNGKNANHKVKQMGLELATYNITFQWISGAKNKAADYLSCLVELPSMPSASINVVSVSTKTDQLLTPEANSATSASD